MASEKSTSGVAGRPPTPADLDEDARTQLQALREVLFIYPETMTLDELTRELTFASPQFSDHDRIHRAVRDLAAGGLFHPVADDGFVRPTRAAVNYRELAEL